MRSPLGCTCLEFSWVWKTFCLQTSLTIVEKAESVHLAFSGSRQRLQDSCSHTVCSGTCSWQPTKLRLTAKACKMNDSSADLDLEQQQSVWQIFGRLADTLARPWLNILPKRLTSISIHCLMEDCITMMQVLFYSLLNGRYHIEPPLRLVM